jgi:hypothetical protein
VNTCCLNLLFSVSNINLFSILFLGFIQIQRFVPKGSDFHGVFYSLKNIDFFFSWKQNNVYTVILLLVFAADGYKNVNLLFCFTGHSLNLYRSSFFGKVESLR